MHQKGFPIQIQGIKTTKNVQIDPQTTEIWPNKSHSPPPLKTRKCAFNHQIWLPYQIVVNKNVNNVQTNLSNYKEAELLNNEPKN